MLLRQPAVHGEPTIRREVAHSQGASAPIEAGSPDSPPFRVEALFARRRLRLVASSKPHRFGEDPRLIAKASMGSPLSHPKTIQSPDVRSGRADTANGATRTALLATQDSQVGVLHR